MWPLHVTGASDSTEAGFQEAERGTFKPVKQPCLKQAQHHFCQLSLAETVLGPTQIQGGRKIDSTS